MLCRVPEGPHSGIYPSGKRKYGQQGRRTDGDGKPERTEATGGVDGPAEISVEKEKREGADE